MAKCVDREINAVLCGYRELLFGEKQCAAQIVSSPSSSQLKTAEDAMISEVIRCRPVSHRYIERAFVHFNLMLQSGYIRYQEEWYRGSL